MVKPYLFAGRTRRPLLAVATVVLLTIGIACDGEETTPTLAPTATPTRTATPTPAPTATPTPTPVPGGFVAGTATPTRSATAVVTLAPSSPEAMAILAASVQSLARVQSYRFVMNSTTNIQQTGVNFTVPTKFVGDFAAPDRQRGTITTTVFGMNIETKTVRIGATTYSTDASTGKWQVSQDSAPADPQSVLATNLDQVQNLVLIGEESYAGGRAHRLSGRMPVDINTASPTLITAELWIDTQTKLPVRMKGTGDIPLDESSNPFGGTGGPATATLTFDLTVSDFNKPVTIEAPAVGSTAS